jgi:hypothetical protein
MSSSIDFVIPVSEESEGFLTRLYELDKWPGWEDCNGRVIVVLDGFQDVRWNALKDEFGNRQRFLLIYLNEQSGSDTCNLCRILHADSDLVVTMDPNGHYMLSDVSVLENALLKSNCKIIYGYPTRQSPNWLDNLIYRIRADFFSLFTSLPAYISEFRVMRSEIKAALSAENQRTFMLDKLLLEGSVYAGIPVNLSKGVKRSKVVKNRIHSKLSFENLLAASNLPEFMGIALLLLNIFFLIEGWIWQSFAITVLVAVAMINIYLIKWKPKLSFNIRERINLNLFVN